MTGRRGLPPPSDHPQSPQPPPALPSGPAGDPHELLIAWERDLRRFSDETREHYRNFFKRFLKWIDERGLTLAAVTRDDVRLYLEDLRVTCSPTSVRMYLASVRSFYRWAVNEKGAPVDPTEGIPLPKVPRDVHKRDRLTDEEIMAMLATCDDTPIGRRDRAIICLAFYCTMRRIEVHRADIGDLEEREHREIIWIWGKGHEGKDSYKILPPPAESALQDWLAVRPGPRTGPLFTDLNKGKDGRRMGKYAIAMRIRQRMSRVGINDPRKTPHSLRHAGASNAIEHGATLFQTKEMLGHKDVATTMVYVHGKDRLKYPGEDLIILNHGAQEKES
jgi:integrase/recombinase XerD